MTDSKIAVLIKARYDHTDNRPISSYMIYIGSQVTRRKGDDIDSDVSFLGVKYSNKKVIDKIFKGDSYLDYISDRRGSTGMFTDPNMDILSVIKEASKFNGYYFMPFISMRERDARKYNIMSQHDFEHAVIMAMKEMPEILKIHRRDFRFLAAFHIKPKEKQNNNGAGKQPHVHLIMWDRSNDRRKFKMSFREIDKFNTVVNKFLFIKHRSQYYSKRNSIRDKLIKEIFLVLENDLNYRSDLEKLKGSLDKIRNGSGSLHYGTILKEYNMLAYNDDYYNSGKDFLTKNVHLSLTRYLYRDFIEQMKQLTSKLLKSSGKLDELLALWRLTSNQMREYEGEKRSHDSTQRDYEALLTIIYNKIIRTAAYQSETIKDTWVLDEVTFLIEKGSLKYKNVDSNVQMELARIFMRASFFKHQGDMKKMSHTMGQLRDMFGDLNLSWFFFYDYYKELTEMNILTNPGLYLEELELISENIEIQYSSYHPKGYTVLTDRNQWITSDPFGLTIHTKKESPISDFVYKLRKEEAIKNEEKMNTSFKELFDSLNLQKPSKSNQPTRVEEEYAISPFETSEDIKPLNKAPKVKKEKPKPVPNKVDDFEEDQKIIEENLEYDHDPVEIDEYEEDYSQGSDLEM